MVTNFWIEGVYDSKVFDAVVMSADTGLEVFWLGFGLGFTLFIFALMMRLVRRVRGNGVSNIGDTL